MGSAAQDVDEIKTCHIDYKQAAEYWQRMYEQTFFDTEYGSIPATEENTAKHGWVRERTCNLIEDGDLLHCSNCGGAAAKQSWAYWSYCPNCGAKVVNA